MDFRQKFFLAVLACQIGTALFPATYAQSRPERRKFYAGIAIGVGLLELSRNNFPEDRKSRFALGFHGGYSPFHWLRAGLDLNGWLIEPYDINNPSKGISISNTYGQIEVFPCKKFNFLISLEGGVAKYMNQHPTEYYARGTGIKFGLGYEHEAAKHLAISMTVNYCSGHFDDVLYPLPTINQHYNTVEFLLGITYH